MQGESGVLRVGVLPALRACGGGVVGERRPRDQARAHLSGGHVTRLVAGGAGLDVAAVFEQQADHVGVALVGEED